MRVTQNTQFKSTIQNVLNSRTQYHELMEKLTSMKRVNRASDDPVAAARIVDIRKDLAAIAQYQTNANNCDAWISATETKLSAAVDLLVKAQEIAVGQATATATAATRQMAANEIQSIIDEMSSLANAKLGERYLFSGSRTDIAPFTKTATAATIEPAVAAGQNNFKGTVASGGAYTGAGNKTYVVKITSEGVKPKANATYQFSTDGGKTWNGVDLSLAGGTAAVGDGVVLTFDDLGGAENFGQNDVFHVGAVAAGYYRGNNEELRVAIDRGTDINYNISGAGAFTAAGSPGSDVFKTLNDLKDALITNNPSGISGQLDNLKNAHSQLVLNQSLCGAKANHIELVRNNAQTFNLQLQSLLSGIEDADIAELSTQLSLKEVALQASYTVAARIGDMTILNYLR